MKESGKRTDIVFLKYIRKGQILMSVYVDFNVKYPPLVSDLKQT